MKVLRNLSKLYLNLVWESTVLLALCSGEYQPGPNQFARADLDRLLPPDSKVNIYQLMSHVMLHIVMKIFHKVLNI